MQEYNPDLLKEWLNDKETSCAKQIDKILNLAERSNISKEEITQLQEIFRFYIKSALSSDNQNQVIKIISNNSTEDNRLLKYFMQDSQIKQNINQLQSSAEENKAVIHLKSYLNSDLKRNNRLLLDPHNFVNKDALFTKEFMFDAEFFFDFLSNEIEQEANIPINENTIQDAKKFIYHALNQTGNLFLMEHQDLMIKIIRQSNLLSSIYPQEKDKIQFLIKLSQKASIQPVIRNNSIVKINPNLVSAHCLNQLDQLDLSLLSEEEKMNFLNFYYDLESNYIRDHAENHAKSSSVSEEMFKFQLQLRPDFNAKVNQYTEITSFSPLFKVFAQWSSSLEEKIKFLEFYALEFENTSTFSRYLFYQHLADYIDNLEDSQKNLFLQTLQNQKNPLLLNEILSESPSVYKYYTENFNSNRFKEPNKFINDTFDEITNRLHYYTVRDHDQEVVDLRNALKNFNQMSFEEQMKKLSRVALKSDPGTFNVVVKIINNVHILRIHLSAIEEVLEKSSHLLKGNELVKITEQLEKIFSTIQNDTVWVSDIIDNTELQLKVSTLLDQTKKLKNDRSRLASLIKNVLDKNWKRNQLSIDENIFLESLFINDNDLPNYKNKEQEFLFKIKLLPSQGVHNVNHLKINLSPEEWSQFKPETKLDFFQIINKPERWVNQFVHQNGNNLDARASMQVILRAGGDTKSPGFLQDPAFLLKEDLINNTSKGNILHYIFEKNKLDNVPSDNIISFFKKVQNQEIKINKKMIILNEENLFHYRDMIKKESPLLYNQIVKLFPNYAK